MHNLTEWQPGSRHTWLLAVSSAMMSCHACCSSACTTAPWPQREALCAFTYMLLIIALQVDQKGLHIMQMRSSSLSQCCVSLALLERVLLLCTSIASIAPQA